MNGKAIKVVAVIEPGGLREKVKATLDTQGVCFLDQFFDWHNRVTIPEAVRAVIIAYSSEQEHWLAYFTIRRHFENAQVIFVLPDARVRIDSRGLGENFFALTENQIELGLPGLLARVLAS